MSRPVSPRLIERYHRAIYAIDMLGPGACGDRHMLRAYWGQMQLACAMKAPDDSIAEHEAAVDRTVADMTDLVERALAYEKDRDRLFWQKQRDFIVGSLRRVKRATMIAQKTDWRHIIMAARMRRSAMLEAIKHLHFFSDAEVFNVEMNHPVFQVSYWLWQAVRAELRTAMSLTQLHAVEHPAVAELHRAIQRITWALEHADVTKLDHYDPLKSPLGVSAEQQGLQLWEAVREEIAGATALAEGRNAA